ncbi:hypothetical protein N8613_02340, partial [Verrucomicrobia bacterium]|nr:hypothetical protein [Verrucomicrobiota bacterium]
ISSSNQEVVGVNFGILSDADSEEVYVHLQALGLLGESIIKITRLADYLSDVESNQNGSSFIVKVDMPSAGTIDHGYPYYTDDPTIYSPSFPAWGGAFGGNNSQNTFYGGSSRYAEIVRRNGSENFRIINLIFTTTDPDGRYTDGSKQLYVEKVKNIIEETFDESLAHISPQEYFKQSTYGQSSILLENGSGLMVVDLNRDLTRMNGKLFEREYSKRLTNINFNYTDYASAGTNSISLARPNNVGDLLEWISPIITTSFGETIQLNIGPDCDRFAVAKAKYPNDLGVKSPLDDLVNYNAFIDSDQVIHVTENIDDSLIEYKAMLKPGTYYIYLDYKFIDQPAESLHAFEIELTITDKDFYLNRPREMQQYIQPQANLALEQAGINIDNLIQIWWLPQIEHPEYQVTISPWAFGGPMVSIGSGWASSIDRTTKLIVHELGHTIQKLPDHYWSGGWGHTEGSRARRLSIHDVMASQGEFADHILATKISRGWIPEEKVGVFNPASFPLEGDAININRKYKLANLNNGNLQLGGDVLGGVEIRLADGNNLNVEYRGPDKNGFFLFPEYRTKTITYHDPQNNFILTGPEPTPDKYFRVIENWTDLSRELDVFSALKQGVAQSSALLAQSDFDTHLVGIRQNFAGLADPNAIENFILNNGINADTQWITTPVDDFELKHDGPFLIPSRPGQELVLDNLSENSLLEELIVSPSSDFNDDWGEIEINYTKVNASDVPNNGADPSIRPWQGNYQSPDIWVVNDLNRDEPELFNVPHPSLDNELHVQVHNNSWLPLKNVRVEVKVRDYNASSAPSAAWASLGLHTIEEIQGNSKAVSIWDGGETRGVFSRGIESGGMKHKCIKVEIKPWSGTHTIENQPVVFQESGAALRNNETQSNYTWAVSNSSSPADIDTVPVNLKNFYDSALEYELHAAPSVPFFQVFNPNPKFTLLPGEEITVPIGVQYLSDVRSNYKSATPYNNGYIKVSSVVSFNVEHDDEHSVEHGHPVPDGGGSIKVFGGQKINIQLAERSKVLEGTVKSIAGTEISGGNVRGVLVNEANESVHTFTAAVSSGGVFQSDGLDFTAKIVLCFIPDEYSDYSFTFKEFGALSE